MSGEAPRTYSGPLGGRRRRRQGHLRWALLAGLAAGIVWFFWSTRDNYAMSSLIPAEQRYRVYTVGLAAQRAHIVASPVWELVPEDTALHAVRTQLEGNLGFPEWVVNNVIYGVCQFSGNDVQQFEDVLFVTKMSRIGCFIEGLRRFFIPVEEDYAGGLRLRHLPDAGLHYAVRGRVILVSPSRDAVIRALTLTREAALAPERLQEAAAGLREANLYGHVMLEPDDPFGEFFAAVRVSARFEAQGLAADASARLRETWRERLAGLLDGATPRPLLTPPPGKVQAAFNLDRNLREIWLGIGAAREDEGAMASQWEAWSDIDALGLDAAPIYVTTLLGPLGPNLALSWHGIDPDAMLPLPEIAVRCDADPALVEDMINTLPSPPADAPAWAMFPRRHPEFRRLYLPVLGGPLLEPAAWLQGRHLMIASGRRTADRLQATPPELASLGKEGNFYLRIEPGPAVRAATEGLAPYAEARLLRGMDAAGFRDAARVWQDRADRVRDATLLVSHRAGEINAAFGLRMAVSAEGP